MLPVAKVRPSGEKTMLLMIPVCSMCSGSLGSMPLSLPDCASQMLSTNTPRTERVFRGATMNFPSGENASTCESLSHGPPAKKRFVEPSSTLWTTPLRNSQTEMPASASVARRLPSGENASGPRAPRSRTVFAQVEVSQTFTTPLLIAASREPSGDRVMAPKFLSKAFCSVQSVVFQTLIAEPDVKRLLPSTENATELIGSGIVLIRVFL